MGNKISKKSKNELICLIHLDYEHKKNVICKFDYFQTIHNQTFMFFKPSKKIDYLKYENVNLEIKEKQKSPPESLYQDFELLNSLVNDDSTGRGNTNMSKLFDASFNMSQNLNYNQIEGKLYLEKHIASIHNNYSVKIRIDPESNFVKEILFILPSGDFNALNLEI